MTPCTFVDFFKKASGFSPYPYQQSLATEYSIPDILSIPTGAGKTEAAVLCLWMWRRLNPRTRRRTPRRLVYCLPMRSLVEQTKKRICDYVSRLSMDGKIHVITLVGGNTDKDYVLCPEDDMIIVGTQDMLLSRALNRGYASGPFRWPVEFGLLNNDCMWVIDEIQLMRNGLATSVQLDMFRKEMGTYGPPHKTVWMSATINWQQLQTVDSPSVDSMQVVELSNEDNLNSDLKKRNTAKKILKVMDFEKGKRENYTSTEVEQILDVHVHGTMTLVVVNTVKRAQSLYEQTTKMLEKRNTRIVPLLLHSRFRDHDRQAITNKIYEQNEDVIIISTQVVEAGMDISARTLITENAPWPSLIQRFGRCNRRGEYNTADIYIIPLKTDANAPYDKEDIAESSKIIKQKVGESMSPLHAGFDNEVSNAYDSVIRMPDIINLFDNSPDISGGRTDVSKYVRSNEESRDVHVFWRTWNKARGPLNYRVQRGEMCSVPIGDLVHRHMMYAYNYVDGVWKKIRGSDVRPGQIILLHCNDGGYTPDIGWNPDSNITVHELSECEEGKSDDPLSQNSKRLITLREHTANVVKEMADINSRITYNAEWPAEILIKAAILHDIGKAHRVFQNAIKDRTDKTIYAKCKSMKKYAITNFRHEAISAMTILNKADGQKDGIDWRLIAYIVASHHGRVRMSMRNPSGVVLMNGIEYVAGVSVGSTDTMPNFLAAIVRDSTVGKLKINGWDDDKLIIGPSIAKVGRPSQGGMSWIQMTHELLAKHGPFRLAFLEAVFRAADWRASNKEAKENA